MPDESPTAPGPGAPDHTEPDEREQTVGCVAGSLWALTSLAGGASLAWLRGPARTWVGLAIGVPWLIFGLWWLGLFARRTVSPQRPISPVWVSGTPSAGTRSGRPGQLEAISG